ncbi:MAG: hypothetical protein ACTHMJ_13440 [Thermomicrobiales bacterium]
MASVTDQEWAARLASWHEPTAHARAEALLWLGEHAPETLTAEHIAAFADTAPEVRAAAAVVFRSSPDPALINRARLALRELVFSPPPARYAGLRAAARLANPTLAPRLLPLLADTDSETRRLTLLALAAVPPRLLPPGFLRAHATTSLADPDRGVRAAAETLLAQAERAASRQPGDPCQTNR